MSFKEYNRKGYSVLPVIAHQKRPVEKNWTNKEATVEELEQYEKAGHSIGIKTKNTPAVDVDISDLAIQQLMLDFINKKCSADFIRMGKRPLLPFKTNQPFKKMVSKKYVCPNGEFHQIEVLGDGQQFVIAGMHPDGFEYKLNKPLPDRDDLIELTPEMAQEIINYFESIVPSGWVLADKAGEVNGEEKSPLFLADWQVEEYVEKSKFNPDIYDEWVKMGLALKHQYEGGTKGLEIWDKWSSQSDKYNPDEFQKRWDGFKPTDITFASIIFNGKEKEKSLKDKFFFVKPLNKFYDRATGDILIAQAVNQSEIGIYINEGDKKPAPATVSFKYLGGQSVSGLTWQPNAHNQPKEELVSVDDKLMVNAYRKPIDLTPDPDETKVQPYINLVQYLIPDEKIRDVYLDHIASTMQYPEIKINWQILLMGTTRIGKDFSLKPLAWYMGDMYSEIDPDDEEANKWGDIKAKKKVLTYQEVHRPKDRKFTNGLKTLAASTSSGLSRLNLKGGGQIVQLNLYSIYAMSNYPDPIHLEHDDARWFAISALDVIQKDAQYYIDLYNWFMGDGNRLVASWLLARDLSHFNPGKLPFHTQARADVIEHSYSDVYREVESMLHHKEGVFHDDIPVFTLTMLKQYLERTGKRRINEAILADEIHGLNLIKCKNQARKMVDGNRETARLWENPNSSVNTDDGGHGLPMSSAELWPLYEKAQKELKDIIWYASRGY